MAIYKCVQQKCGPVFGGRFNKFPKTVFDSGSCVIVIRVEEAPSCCTNTVLNQVKGNARQMVVCGKCTDLIFCHHWYCYVRSLSTIHKQTIVSF